MPSAINDEPAGAAESLETVGRPREPMTSRAGSQSPGAVRHQSDQDEDDAEKGHLHARGSAIGFDELGKDGDEEHDGFRVRDADDHAVDEQRPAWANDLRCLQHSRQLPTVTDRLDTEPDHVARSEELDDGEREHRSFDHDA